MSIGTDTNIRNFIKNNYLCCGNFVFAQEVGICKAMIF